LRALCVARRPGEGLSLARPNFGAHSWPLLDRATILDR
jgi:hypothetical protein